METFRSFKTLQAARDYRFERGCGGWIFEDEATKESIIFPPHMTPTAILYHPLAHGKAGMLIGCS